MNKNELNEIVRQLRIANFRCESSDFEGQHCLVYQNENQLGIIFENGRFNTNAHPVVSSVVKNTTEYLNHYQKAQALQASGLSDGYKKLLEFNGYVLAMKALHSLESYEFVTWEYSPDGSSVNLGHYYNDYLAAKEDFANRSGLIDINKLLSETQLKIIYTSLISYVALNGNLDYKSEKVIGKILDKISTAIPEILNRGLLEEEELLPDDGLEL